MHLKNIILTALLIAMLIEFLTFGYLAYTFFNDTTTTGGKELVKKHPLFFYSTLMLKLVEFGIVGTIIYKG